jgi:hypothetical protein
VPGGVGLVLHDDRPVLLDVLHVVADLAADRALLEVVGLLELFLGRIFHAEMLSAEDRLTTGRMLRGADGTGSARRIGWCERMHS